MFAPTCRITVDGTDYDNIVQSFNVKKRECNYDVATLTLPDPVFDAYNTLSVFEEIEIALKDPAEETYTQIFGGTINQTNPVQNQNERQTILNCKGYGAALENTHCNWDMGEESSHPDYFDTWSILGNTINNFVNKSFAGSSTGHGLTYTYIANFVAPHIKYINNPYRSNLDLVNIICKLTSAIGAGTSAGGHWIVDNNKRFLFGQIGDHTAGTTSPESYWPDWWDTDAAGSTLTQGEDFETFTILEKIEEYANNVVLLTDFRRPSYDYWTENGVENDVWDYDGDTLEDHTSGVGSPDVVVGTDYILIENAHAWLPAAENASWDITKWGSEKTIPRLNFYMYKNDLVNANCQIRLFTTNHTTDYFYCQLSTLNDADDEWIAKSIPIGPYWASTDEARHFRWSENGSPDWEDINGLSFYIVDNGVDPGYLCLDDLHFTGKIVRSAKHSQAITANNEYQKVLISRNSMDDSCAASDDTGFAARIAYAELLRRIIQPRTSQFTTPTDMRTAMAGQKIHVHACKQVGGTFGIDADMRIIELIHNYSYLDGYSASVTATTDLKNSFPINIPDQYAMWQENMFVNSAEAKNIRSGAEVDLLIPPLIYDYGP